MAEELAVYFIQQEYCEGWKGRSGTSLHCIDERRFALLEFFFPWDEQRQGSMEELTDRLCELVGAIGFGSLCEQGCLVSLMSPFILFSMIHREAKADADPYLR